MGRRPYSDRKTVEECHSVSIFGLHGKTIKSFENPLFEFDYTPCNYGGKRRWFLCPICKRRVGKLYTTRLDNRFACRKCHNLTFESSKTHYTRIDAIINNPEHPAIDRMKQGSLKDARLILRAYIRGKRKRELRVLRNLKHL